MCFGDVQVSPSSCPSRPLLSHARTMTLLLLTMKAIQSCPSMIHFFHNTCSSTLGLCLGWYGHLMVLSKNTYIRDWYEYDNAPLIFLNTKLSHAAYVFLCDTSIIYSKHKEASMYCIVLIALSRCNRVFTRRLRLCHSHTVYRRVVRKGGREGPNRVESEV